MTVSELCRVAGLQALAMPAPDRKVSGGYAGDLLSWVMSRAEPGDVWVTIMTNINIIAVSHIADIAAVIIAEGAEVGSDVIGKAGEQGINILRSTADTFDIILSVGRILEMK